MVECCDNGQCLISRFSKIISRKSRNQNKKKQREQANHINSMNDFQLFLKKSVNHRRWSNLMNELVPVIYGVKVAVIVESCALNQSQLLRICRQIEQVCLFLHFISFG